MFRVLATGLSNRIDTRTGICLTLKSLKLQPPSAHVRGLSASQRIGEDVRTFRAFVVVVMRVGDAKLQTPGARGW